MTVVVDTNESRNTDIVPLLQQSVDVVVSATNQSPGGTVLYPDFTCIGGDHILGINRKTVHEILGDMDACRDQLQRELRNSPIDRLVLCIEGVWKPSRDGIWVYKETEGGYKRQHLYHQPWQHVFSWMYRLWVLGVPVLVVPNQQALATSIIQLHQQSYKSDEEQASMFNRLVKKRFYIEEGDEQRRRFILQVMGLEAGWGEELADAAATMLEERAYANPIHPWPKQPTLSFLIGMVENNPEWVASSPLRSGKRTIGPAAVKRLREALGV